MATRPWPERPLSALVEIVRETIGPNRLCATRKVRLYSLPSFDASRDPEHVTGSSIKSGKYLVPADCLLLSKLNPRIPRVWRVRRSEEVLAVSSTEFWPIVARSEEIDLDFLAYVLGSNAFLDHPLIKPAATTKSHQRIELSALGRFTFAVPPPELQRGIAASLSSIDDTIEATQAVIEQLQVVKEAMLEELLARGIPGLHDLFKKTDVGYIPRDWEVRRLGEVAEVRTGIAKGKVFVAGVVAPYLRVANVQDGYLDLAEVKTISVAPEMLSRFSLRTGDVLFTEGGDADKLGRGTVWRDEIQGCLHQNHVFAVRPYLGVLIPEFLASWASASRGRAYFLNSAKQTTNLASINSTQLKAFPVAIPTIAEQEKIVDHLSSFQTRIDVERAKAEALSSLKSAFLPALLTGEIRVPLEKASA
jgi:type I restriction enzyme S subunit